MTFSDETVTEFEFTVTRRAAETIQAMRNHVEKIGTDWGKASPEYQEALDSFARQVSTIFSNPIAPKTTVGKDGDLSLIVSSGIVFGVIFHGTKRYCTTEECGAYLNDDGHAWTYDRERRPVLEHEHVPSYPLDAAQPGTWSFHS